MKRMAAKKRPPVDPLARLSAQGFLGYVEEDGAETSPYKVLDIALDTIYDSHYQSREQRDPRRFRQLVHSIQTHGFQGTLVVCPHPQHEGSYQLIAGGHRRRDAAREAGLQTLPCLVVAYDRQRMAVGTAAENLVREDLSVPDEGKLYLQLRQDAGWTQEQLAEQLDVSRDRIKECEVVARDAEDIQQMLCTAGDRGLRAAKALRQLDRFDEPAQGILRAAGERAPIIARFLREELTTDGVQLAVTAVITRLELQDTLAAAEPVRDVSPHEIRRHERVTTILKRFVSWQKLIGDQPLYPEERETLTRLAQEIQTCLARRSDPDGSS
jgi:ParB/RepB/Spo0J family partition protein